MGIQSKTSLKLKQTKTKRETLLSFLSPLSFRLKKTFVFFGKNSGTCYEQIPEWLKINFRLPWNSAGYVKPQLQNYEKKSEPSRGWTKNPSS